MQEDNRWAGTILKIAQGGRYQMLDAVIDLGDDIRIEIRIEVEDGNLKVLLRSLLPLTIPKDDKSVCVGRKQGAWVEVPGGWKIHNNKPESKKELALDVTVDKDSILTLEDKDGACEVRLEFKVGEHITVYTDEQPGGWVIGVQGGFCGPGAVELEKELREHEVDNHKG